MGLQITPTTCRVCLRSAKRLSRSLFDELKGGLISEKICSIADVKITKGDELPSKICTKCLASLNIAYDFKLICEKSDKLLLSSINEEKEKSCIVQKKEEDTLEESDPVTCDVDCAASYDDEVKQEHEAPYTEYLQEQDNTYKLEDQCRMIPNFPNLDEPEVYEIKAQNHKLFTHGAKRNIKIALTDKRTSPALQLNADVDVNSSHQSNSNLNVTRPSRAIDLKLECHDCRGSFKSKCKLRVHWKKVHLPEKLCCTKCKRQFRSFVTFNKHSEKACINVTDISVEGKGMKRVYHCKKCEYSSKHINALRNHFNIHAGIRPHKCKLCSNSYTQLSSLHSHMERAHEIYKVEMTCPYCGIQVKGKDKVNTHLAKHSSQRYQCDICKAFLKSKRSLIQHFKIHEDTKSYACNLCTAKFNVASNLHQHMRKKHRKDKIQSCDLCEYKTHVKESLKKHRAKHTGHNFACRVCGSFHEDADKLQKHLRIHFGERNFECPHCSKKFLSHQDVGCHVRKIHKCGYITYFKFKSKVKEDSDVSFD